jgi:hypothetical protein
MEVIRGIKMKKINILLLMFIFLFCLNLIEANAVTTRFSYYSNGTSFNIGDCSNSSSFNDGSWVSYSFTGGGLCTGGGARGLFDGVINVDVGGNGIPIQPNAWASASFPVGKPNQSFQIFIPETIKLIQYELFFVNDLYGFNFGYGSPRNWSVYGSNDNTTWDLIGKENINNSDDYPDYVSILDAYHTNNAGFFPSTNFTTNATINYSSYKWVITEISNHPLLLAGNIPISLKEVVLYIDIPPIPIVPLANVTTTSVFFATSYGSIYFIGFAIFVVLALFFAEILNSGILRFFAGLLLFALSLSIYRINGLFGGILTGFSLLLIIRSWLWK